MAEQDFLEWFKQTVTIEPYYGQNQYAEPIYGLPIEYPAFVQRKTKLVRSAAGKEVVSTAQVYLNGTVNIDIQDRITLPDGSQPAILSVEVLPDELGNVHHVVVYT